MIQLVLFDASLTKKFTARNGWQLTVWLVLLLMFSATVLAQPDNSAREQRFADAALGIASRFPDVQHISIDDYRDKYQDALLLDVRTAAEFQVSRLPGAVHAAGREQLVHLAQQHRQLHPRSAVLLYCSLGWRSAEAAQYLQQQGVASVMNLQGSIFAWGNRGLAVENDAGPVRQIHPYNALWGWLYLDKDLR